jgi:hypothetical protein
VRKSASPSLTSQLAKPVVTLNYIGIDDERGGGEFGPVRPEVEYLYEAQNPQGVITVPSDNDAKRMQVSRR